MSWRNRNRAMGIVMLALASATAANAQEPKSNSEPVAAVADTRQELSEAEKLILLLKQKSRWTLGPKAVLFGDDDTEVSAGVVSSVQIRDYAMTVDELGALGAPAAAGVPAAPPGRAAVQWNFDGNFESVDGKSTLKPRFCPPAEKPFTEFVEVEMGEGTAGAVRFSAGTCFELVHPLRDAKGSPWLLDYTLIMDVMFPEMVSGWAALLQTDTENKSDAEWFNSQRKGLGVTDVYGGRVPDGVWHRLALVLNGSQALLSSFINGTQVQQKRMDLRNELYNRARHEDVAEWTTLMSKLIALDDPQTRLEAQQLGVRLQQAPLDGRVARITPQLFQRLPQAARNIRLRLGPARPIDSGESQYRAKSTKKLIQELWARSRWTLGPLARLLADEAQENAGGFINALQLRNYAMTDAEVAALGGVAKTLPLSSGLGSGSVRIAQWDFDGDLESSSGGAPLVPDYCPPSLEADWEFVPFPAGATKAGAVRFGRGTCFQVRTELSDDPDQPLLLNYSVVMDVKFEERPVGWVALWQNDFGNRTDADWFIDKKKRIGIRDLYGGLVEDGTWNRLALVVDGELGTISHYVNGAKVRAKRMIMEDEIRRRGGGESDLSAIDGILKVLGERDEPEAREAVDRFSKRMHNDPDPEHVANSIPLAVLAVDAVTTNGIVNALLRHQLAPRVEDFYPERHRCDETGRAQIDIPIPVPPNIHLVVSAPGYAPAYREVAGADVLARAAATQTIALKKSVRLGGRVVDQNDKPVPGVTVRFDFQGQDEVSQNSPLRVVEGEVTTSDEGAWEVSWIPEDVQELIITLEHADYGNASAAIKSGGRIWEQLAKSEAIMRIHRKF